VEKHKKNLIIIHGAGPKHYRSLKDGTGDWQAKLPTLLGDQYKVITPQFPSPKNPSYEEWKILLDKNLAKLQGEVTFVGHSLGGSFLLKYLSEEKITQKISGLFLVSAPFNTVKGFEAPTDFSIFSRMENIFLYHCMDDVEVPYAHAVIYQDRMNAKLRTFNDRGHYFKRADFPEISQDIRNSSLKINLTLY
jgi:predicted alpha/beta hydrolase family esterase